MNPPSTMLALDEDPRLIASHLRTLVTLGSVVVSTYDEVIAVQALNDAAEAQPDTQMGREVYVVTLRAPTTREAAEAAGTTKFDTALPQPWVDHFSVVAGDPRGHFVWSYDRVCGEPFPTTERGTDLLRLFCQATAPPVTPGRKTRADAWAALDAAGADTIPYEDDLC